MGSFCKARRATALFVGLFEAAMHSQALVSRIEITTRIYATNLRRGQWAPFECERALITSTLRSSMTPRAG